LGWEDGWLNGRQRRAGDLENKGILSDSEFGVIAIDWRFLLSHGMINPFAGLRGFSA